MEIIYLPLILFCQFLLMFALGILLALGNVYFRDLERLVPVILRATWFLSPVFYQVSDVIRSSSIPNWGKKVFQLNPLSDLLTGYRSVILYGETPDVLPFLIWIVVAMVLLAAGTLALQRTEGTIAKML